MVAAAARNDGIVMQPYLVESVRSADLQLLSQTRPSQLRLATSAANAAKLRQMMVGVVENGTGFRPRSRGWSSAARPGRRTRQRPDALCLVHRLCRRSQCRGLRVRPGCADAEHRRGRRPCGCAHRESRHPGTAMRLPAPVGRQWTATEEKGTY